MKNLKVGDYLIAIDECVMTSSSLPALIIGKKYRIKNVDNNNIYIKSRFYSDHAYPFEDLIEFFKLPNEKNIYNKAFEHFGHNNQLLKCVEEMAQLTQSIIKGQFVCRSSENLTKEIVDVEIMIKQLKTIIDIELYQDYKKQKLNKLKELIK